MRVNYDVLREREAFPVRRPAAMDEVRVEVSLDVLAEVHPRVPSLAYQENQVEVLVDRGEKHRVAIRAARVQEVQEEDRHHRPSSSC